MLFSRTLLCAFYSALQSNVTVVPQANGTMAHAAMELLRNGCLHNLEAKAVCVLRVETEPSSLTETV